MVKGEHLRPLMGFMLVCCTAALILATGLTTPAAIRNIVAQQRVLPVPTISDTVRGHTLAGSEVSSTGGGGATPVAEQRTSLVLASFPHTAPAATPAPRIRDHAPRHHHKAKPATSTAKPATKPASTPTQAAGSAAGSGSSTSGDGATQASGSTHVVGNGGWKHHGLGPGASTGHSTGHTSGHGWGSTTHLVTAQDHGSQSQGQGRSHGSGHHGWGHSSHHAFHPGSSTPASHQQSHHGWSGSHLSWGTGGTARNSTTHGHGSWHGNGHGNGGHGHGRHW